MSRGGVYIGLGVGVHCVHSNLPDCHHRIDEQLEESTGNLDHVLGNAGEARLAIQSAASCLVHAVAGNGTDCDAQR